MELISSIQIFQVVSDTHPLTMMERNHLSKQLEQIQTT